MKKISIKKVSGPAKKAVLIVQPQFSDIIPVKNSSKIKSAIEGKKTRKM